MALFTQNLVAGAVGVAELTNDAPHGRVTQAYGTVTGLAAAARATQAYATETGHAVRARVTQLYYTFSVVLKSFSELVCPAIAAPIALIQALNQRFVFCPAIAHPLPAMIVVGPNDVRWECPALAKAIPDITTEYTPSVAPFVGGAGVIAAVLPRRQTVLTRALRRRRRRISRRRP